MKGKVLRPDLRQHPGRRYVRWDREVQGSRSRGQRYRRRPAMDHHRRLGVGQEIREASGGRIRIERHVRAARLPHAEDGDRDVYRAVEKERHPRLGTDAQGTEPARQLP